MLTKEEKSFLEFWEKNREQEGTFFSFITKGIPMALIFPAPIALSIVVIKLFFPEWSTKISKTSSGMFLTVLLAVFIIVLFYGYFRMQFKWEHNEQIYQSLKQKQTREEGKND